MLSYFRKQRAARLHAQGQQLQDAGREDEAITRYQQAIALDPKRSESYYNLGLIYKYRGEWSLSFNYNQLANALAPEDEAACWNLGIAATALGDWGEAREAWRQYGIELDDTEGPIEGDFGTNPVRLNPDGAAEVVWANRIDPARARIINVPLPESGFAAGDVVLNDGAPVGYRMLGEHERAVFNVLQLLQPSPNSTFQLTVIVESAKAIEKLEAMLERADMVCEDWTTQYRVLCRACSEGRPHEQHEHDHDVEQEWQPRHEIGIAALSRQEIETVIAQWENSAYGRVEGLECLLQR